MNRMVFDSMNHEQMEDALLMVQQRASMLVGFAVNALTDEQGRADLFEAMQATVDEIVEQLARAKRTASQ